MPELDEKERILFTAQEKFFNQGFSKVTVDEIASDLGMSKKTIYKFFPSKDEMMRAVIHFMMKRVEREVDFIVSSNRPFDEKMTQFLAFIGSIWGRGGRQLPVDIKKYAPDLWKEVETFRREHLLTKVQSMFRQAKDEGVFRPDLNTELFMLMFLHVVDGIMNPTTLSENSFSANEAFRGIFKILFEGALTDEARQQFDFFEPTYSQPLGQRSL